MGEYRRENAKHLFAYLMREKAYACQLTNLDRPSWGCKLTSETIPISIGDPISQLHWKVLKYFFNVWESMIEKTLSTFCIPHEGEGMST